MNSRAAEFFPSAKLCCGQVIPIVKPPDDGRARIESIDCCAAPLFTQPPGWGFPLPIVSLIWAFVVVTLYRACRWFAARKQRHSDPWLSYL